jgi:hypothetical protein
MTSKTGLTESAQAEGKGRRTIVREEQVSMNGERQARKVEAAVILLLPSKRLPVPTYHQKPTQQFGAASNQHYVHSSHKHRLNHRPNQPCC